jgi:hypothetical protein
MEQLERIVLGTAVKGAQRELGQLQAYSTVETGRVASHSHWQHRVMCWAVEH